MGHLVRCRGGTWAIDFPRKRGAKIATARRIDLMAGARSISGLYWNGTTKDSCHTDFRWPSAPGWLPVSWLCCEADPAQGPGLAAAILDAGPGEDAPALIACDWLEERGRAGALPGGDPDGFAMEGWGPHPDRPGAWSGPLASWCRALIAGRCVSCGGRKHYENDDRPRADPSISIDSKERDPPWVVQLLAGEGRLVRAELPQTAARKSDRTPGCRPSGWINPPPSLAIPDLA